MYEQPYAEAVSLWNDILAGKAKAADVKAFVPGALSNEVIKRGVAEVGKMYTLAEIKKKVHMFSGDKKAVGCEQIYVDAVTLLTRPGDEKMISWGMNGSYYDAIIRSANDATDEQIAIFLQEREEKLAGIEKSLTDPATLDEYRFFVTHRGSARLSDAQAAEFDTLLSLDELEKRRNKKEYDARISAVNFDVEFIMLERENDKTGKMVYIAKLTERIERDYWNTILEICKKAGGWWNGWPRYDDTYHGFAFGSTEERDAFVEIVHTGGTVINRWDDFERARLTRTVERLANRADTLAESADEIRGRDTKTNTVKRAGERKSQLENADMLDWTAEKCQAVADVIANDETRFLSGVRFGTDIDTLSSYLNQARWEAHNRKMSDPEYNRGYQRNGLPPVSLADIRYFMYPWPKIDKVTLLKIASLCAGKRGLAAYAKSFKKAGSENDGKWYAVIGNHDAVAALAQAAQSLDKWDVQMVSDKLSDYKRLQRMGLTYGFLLRSAMREFLGFIPEKTTHTDAVEVMRLNIVGQKIPGFFPTPKDLAERMADDLNLIPGDKVLEPSAGMGDLANAVKPYAVDVLCIEPVWALKEILEAQGYETRYDSFEDYYTGLVEAGITFDTTFDAVIMNPPFENNQDIAHFRMAYRLLRKGGRIGAILSNHWTFASDAASVQFREWLEEQTDLNWEHLPEGSFKSSFRPTGVNTTYIYGVMD